MLGLSARPAPGQRSEPPVSQLKLVLRSVAEAVRAKGLKALATLVPGGDALYEIAAEVVERVRHNQKEGRVDPDRQYRLRGHPARAARRLGRQRLGTAGEPQPRPGAGGAWRGWR